MGDDQIHGYTLDEALSSVGFGTFQGVALVFAGIGWLSEAMEMNLLSFIGPAVKSQWSLSPTQESLLSTAVFGGMLLGAFFWGIISDAYGRRVGIRGVAIVIAGAGLLSAFSPDYKSLVVLRSLLGFGVAGGHVFASWFLEFIPSSNRGAWMLSILVFWIFGELFEASLAWIIMPRLGWRWLLALSSIPSLLVVIFASFAPESPRYLFMEGKINESIKVLEEIARINQKELPTGNLISDHQKMHLDEENSPVEEETLLPSFRKKMSNLKMCLNSTFQLFSPDLLGTTLLLLLLHFGFTFAFYGIVLMISAVSSEQKACGSVTVHSINAGDTSLYRNVLITCSAEIPGLVLATVLVDRLGRKLTIETLTLLAFVLILPLSFHQNETVTIALLFCVRMLLFAAFSSLTLYAKEVYPTAIRASGSGLATSVGRIGGMICPLVAVGLLFDFQMGDSNPVYTLNEALATIGFGKYHGFLLAYGGIGWVAEAMEMMILSFVGSAVQSEWGLSPSQKSLISTVVFAGMLVGAYFWGVISDAYGRKKGILGVATITAVAGLLSAFSPNYISLIILRCITGIGLGGMNIFTAWFLEFVPTANRGAWMTVFASFWTIGTIFEAALAWIVMPNFGWRWLVALSSGPSFIVLLFYGLSPESPRFLSTKGRIDEASSILEKVASVNGTPLPIGTLVSDRKDFEDNEFTSSENAHLLDKTYNCKASSSSLLVHFSPKLIRTNLLIWFLYFGNTFSYYGIILLTSELSSGESKCTEITLHLGKNQNASLYIDVFITSLAEVPGLIIAALIVDRLGRKLSMVIMFVLASILLLPLLIHQNEIWTTALLFGARTFVSATFVVAACIYAPEVYPTNIRATGVGIASAIGKIGGMICPLVAVGLVNGCKQTYAVILFQIMILLSALSILLSPFETNGRDLADTLLIIDP
ncbi:hypothetical protein BUALT_Bualt09G0049200 [Buddleja alternifolia]|uniref:Major facilitator superfamily (MFS) profile domain-containing protein n=1 Tax=Buddleja alternifolia TaxID=168488 RepID=A0AAV6X6Q6_9LAMI|nr:hypothetical protein BUALT_Bualt09G0049200 [Buddleja alternifolia]